MVVHLPLPCHAANIANNEKPPQLRHCAFFSEEAADTFGNTVGTVSLPAFR